MANLEECRYCSEAVRQDFIHHYCKNHFKHHHHCSCRSSCCCIKKPVSCIFDEFYEVKLSKSTPTRKVCLLTPLHQK